MGKPVKSAVSISDDEIRASLTNGQLKLLDERGIDLMLALDVPAMIHASVTCNPAFHTTGSHYLNVDAGAA